MSVHGPIGARRLCLKGGHDASCLSNLPSWCSRVSVRCYFVDVCQFMCWITLRCVCMHTLTKDATALKTLSPFTCLLHPDWACFAHPPPSGLKSFLIRWKTRRHEATLSKLLEAGRKVARHSVAVMSFSGYTVLKEGCNRHTSNHIEKASRTQRVCGQKSSGTSRGTTSLPHVKDKPAANRFS